MKIIALLNCLIAIFALTSCTFLARKTKAILSSTARDPRNWIAGVLVSMSDEYLRQEAQKEKRRGVYENRPKNVNTNSAVKNVKSEVMPLMNIEPILLKRTDAEKITAYYEQHHCFHEAGLVCILAALKGNDSSYLKAANLFIKANDYEKAYPLLIKSKDLKLIEANDMRILEIKIKLSELKISGEFISSYESLPDFWINEIILNAFFRNYDFWNEAIKFENLKQIDGAIFSYIAAGINGNNEGFVRAAYLSKSRGQSDYELLLLTMAAMRGDEYSKKRIEEIENSASDAITKNSINKIKESSKELNKNSVEKLWLNAIINNR